jgi:7-keto-8-aminopelargonate synthetase-like enzyme
MYNYPDYAVKVNQIYESYDWEQVVQIPLQGLDLKSNKIMLHDQEAISFGSSSYVGLHKDQRIIESGVDAMRKYGVLYSSSRSYTYLNLHNEFEDLLEKIFGLPVLATIQTTMAHFSGMQILMLPSHAAIMDMNAHATLQSMIQLPKAQGMKVEMIKHNDLDMLEGKIKRLYEHHDKIWYVADGIYSMYGDGAPVSALLQLLDKYEKLHIYFDDAHGMSWAGPHGAGYIWKYLPNGHERVVLATSLGKGFGIGGGALVCPNKEVKQMMTRAGGSTVFCTQLPVQMLGSGIESAKIHLTNEIYTLQDKVKSNIEYFIEMTRQHSLPVIDFSHSPVFFIACGGQQFGLKLCQRVREAGYYVNVGIYPAVGPKNTGLRVSLTSEHSKAEIEGLVKTIAEQMNLLMDEYGITILDVEKAFNLVKMGIAV